MSYLAKKLLYGLLVLVGVVIVVFFLFQGFGDPARLVLGQAGDSATIQNIRKELALDQPKWKQFVLYLNDVSPVAVHSAADIEKKQLKGFFVGGENKLGIKLPYLRRSYQTKKDVGEVLLEALPGTMVLALAAMCIATVIGILLGILAAVKQNTWLDTSSVFASVLGISAPSFFMGIVLAYLFGFVFSQYTGLHMTGSLYNIDPFTGKDLQLKNLVLPAITLGIRPLAIITQLTRSSMLDVLDQDYIRTAYAKGLQKKTVIFRHALRNALNPVITAITGWFAELLAGAFFVEYIFGWKGIGKVTVDALEKLDFPVVMGSVLLTATFFIMVNILADLLYGMVDPRVRVK
ncbi:MAG: ABC transporter permease [Chitinophagaceae bacterium]|nr:ABC transporter permease [Chitinophagaceae bacterium]MCA6452688.1 ABC transporter permease [Chitinophagaceae bacterium]MCA6455774.1 ABC transporter permease [Chitinophagaceae bacterium]MCA6460649.1 ABC transporter permease [Chitinophagaceae bacterium]MCA6464951.1 ABC transporter permease [Chitinophagaceae bacterium]